MKPFILSVCLLAPSAFCQDSLPQNVLKLAPASTVTARSGETVQVALSVQVDAGFHVNSNTPADSYLIPLRLTWTPGPLESPAVSFPKPQKERYPFSTKPVSVFTGSFDIVTRFKVAPAASPGSSVMTGKLHYQACNDHTCLTPKTVDVSVPVEILK
jgi:DsbC/DsbD-like thiol-disulfide interchange protein